jgi:hypothetical protein
MEALIALGGVALGWGLAAGTQIWRDRRQARIALNLVHNELLGNIARLDLARRGGDDDEPPSPSHWYKRWKLSRTAWDQHGGAAMQLLDKEAAMCVQDAYHALDAAELLFEEARDAVAEFASADRPTTELVEFAAAFARLDTASREKIGIQLAALERAHAALDRRLRLEHRDGA